MTIILNGESREVAGGTLSDALVGARLWHGVRLRPRSTATFVAAARRASTTLSAGDAVEVRDAAARRVSPVDFYGVKLTSRLLLGTAQYPSPAILAEAVRASRHRGRDRLAEAESGTRAGRGRASGR